LKAICIESLPVFLVLFALHAALHFVGFLTFDSLAEVSLPITLSPYLWNGPKERNETNAFRSHSKRERNKKNIIIHFFLLQLFEA
jgi:hypothetical protein